MAAKWEYRMVLGTARGAFDVGPDEIIRDAQELWITNLNALGANGWELISERFVTGKYLVSGEQYAQYSGTMKRESA